MTKKGNPSCFARSCGRTLSLGNDSIKIVWTELLGELRARVAGGIWYMRGNEWVKIADMAEGEPSLVDWEQIDALPPGEQRLDPREIATAQPASVDSVCDDPFESSMTLTGGTVVFQDIEWRIREKWTVRAGEKMLRWSFTFTPSKACDARCLLNVRFNVLPHRFRTVTLPSFCGFDGEIAFAVFPEKGDEFWMRLDGPKLIFNTHYPFTYKPTKLANGGNPVTLSGCFLADELPPAELLSKIREHLDPIPDEPEREPEEMLRMASTCIRRSFEAARSTGHFASDEGALIGGFYSDGSRHYHLRGRKTAYDVGFSLGWCGQALSPLLQVSEHAGASWAREAAEKIGNWICSHAQTEYGAFHEVFDIEGRQGADFVGEDLLHTHTTARNAAEMLKLHRATGRERHLLCGLKACDWLLAVQEPSGAIQWKFIDSTGEPEYPPSYAAVAAEALAAWSLAFELTSDKRYVSAGKRLARWAERQFVDRNDYAGFITDDLYAPAPTNGLNRWETPSPTAVCFLIDGFLAFSKVTGDLHYRNVAEKAGRFWGLYQWPWEFPSGCIRKKVKGTTQASGGMPYCIDQIFGSELPLELETLIDLFSATKNHLWLGMFRMALARLPDFQFADPDSPLYGSVLEGWSLTRDIPLPTVQGNLLFTNRIPIVMIKYLGLLESGVQEQDLKRD